MKLSAGSRSFLRYGYGDLLREDRKCGVLHRIWPGTQRLLIWGDPLTAAAHSRAFRFCGSDGVEIMEPLSFKGRRGSGIAGRPLRLRRRVAQPALGLGEVRLQPPRVGPAALQPGRRSGRVAARPARTSSGRPAPDLEAALASSSRILPIVTTAHAPSAGNNTYWPEVYLNHSLVDAAHPGPYTRQPGAAASSAP